MTNPIFIPEHKSINAVFERDLKYIIPSYQRPYSWKSTGKNDTNNQINEMWNDFYNFYDSNIDGQEYFFGSIVVYKDKNGYFQVVDGQQRLTSLLLLFASMKCFLLRAMGIVEDRYANELTRFIEQSISTINDTLYNSETVSLTPVLKVKIEREGQYNFDTVLNEAINCDEISNISIDFDTRNKTIANRYFHNRDYFIEKLNQFFLDDKTGRFTFSNAEKFDEFWRFLRTRISIVLIQTINFDTAYRIFEVLNNRGLPLTNIDLFRNFLVSRLGYDAGKQWHYLETSYNLSNDFLGRFIESTKGSQLQKSSFNEVVEYYDNKKIVGSKIDAFYDEIEQNLQYFTLITNEDNITDKPIHYEVKFMRLLGHERYTINYLMSLFRFFNYDGRANDELLIHLKLYTKLRLYTLLKPYKRFSSSPIYKVIKDLNSKKYDESKEHLSLNLSEIRELKSLIRGDINDNSFGRILIAKFIFESYIQNTDDMVEQELIYNKTTLEHIIPQNPEEGSNWFSDFSKDFREKYTYKLGNFTLLTTKMNSRAKNYAFSRKKDEYKKTSLSITRDLMVDQIDENYIISRHEMIIELLNNCIFVHDDNQPRSSSLSLF